MARIRVKLWTEAAVDFSILLNSARCGELMGLCLQQQMYHAYWRMRLETVRGSYSI